MLRTIITLALVCGACASAGDDLLGELSQNSISQNGISMNGISMNGTTLNGISMNGTSLTGVAISAGSMNGPPLSGANLVGSIWTGTASNGAAVKLRIEAAVAGTAPNPDLWFYAMSYQTSSGWNPLCGLDSADQPILALSVAGVWAATASDAARYTASTTQFTLACRAKTIAKCVELGYRTYKGFTDQLTSCVRLLRGDFCGTGSAYTVDGTTLNLYDNAGVQADTEAWLAEAEWTPSGARCVNSNNASRYELVLSRDPKCVKRVETPTCGNSFASGAVLIDELPQTFMTTSSTTTTKR
jgi:hypothetical protein